MEQEQEQERAEQMQEQVDMTRLRRKSEEPARARSEAWEWTKALLIAAGLVLVIRWLIFAPFIVEGPSMQPNFHTSERLIVNKVIYDIREPKRGEVVVFHASEKMDYIKRVIALPGERVKAEGNKVYVNGEELKEPYIEEAVAEAAKNNQVYTANFPETVVPEGTVFVMGDNRLNSSDSRMTSVGPVDYSKIVGRADIRFWPFSKIGFIKHGS